MSQLFPILFAVQIILIPTVYTSAEQLKLVGFTACLVANGISSSSLAVRTQQNSSLYTALNDKQWNIRKPKVYPLAYFLPKSTFDVQMAVKCGSKFNIPLTPKGGGHSYESAGFGNSHSIIIDLCKMDSIAVNGAEKTATIGPGVLVGQADEVLWQNGGFGVPAGECVTVGLTALALGGGEGFFSTMYGMTADNILAMTMVDAQGGVHSVTCAENSDLFWALRGIGPGYIGIVTSVKFKLFEASKLKLTVVTLAYDTKSFFYQFLVCWQNWLKWIQNNEPMVEADVDTIGTEIKFRTLHIQDAVRQPRDNKEFLKAVSKIFPPTENQSVSTPTYIEHIKNYGTPHALDYLNLRNEKIAPQYMKVKSFFVDNIGFDKASLAKVADLIVGRNERVEKNTWLALTREGGAVHSLAPEATSYVHRKSAYSISPRIQIFGKVSDDEVVEAKGWMAKFMKLTKFMDNGESYQNYMDYERKDYLNRFYGANLERLVSIKKRWDPTNYFKNPESLPIDLI